MIQIDNHNELALASVIPYLLQFPEVYNLAKQSGDRYQVIENIAWQLLYNLDYTTANGVWLDYIGRKVGQDRVYTPKPQNAFTFGGTTPEGFGAGKFKGTSSTRNTKVARSDSSFRNAIKARIIQNNTDTSLDELIEACKLLFNAKLVRITESYPANIASIRLYGSSLIETLDIQSIIKSALPACVSLQHVSFHKFYNLFKNNAFISYNKIIPEKDDFELSLTITPDIIPSSKFVIFSQNTTFASEFVPITCYYDPVEGIIFQTAPNIYNDTNTGLTYYNDEDNKKYVDADTGVTLIGGKLAINENTNMTIKRVGNEWSLYINGNLADQMELDHDITAGEGMNFYLGTSEQSFYNAGSLYNFYLRNNTTGELLINDPLKNKTTGINNGVRFL